MVLSFNDLNWKRQMLTKLELQLQMTLKFKLTSVITTDVSSSTIFAAIILMTEHILDFLQTSRNDQDYKDIIQNNNNNNNYRNLVQTEWWTCNSWAKLAILVTFNMLGWK